MTDYGKCFVCLRKLKGPGITVQASDDQKPWIGPECARKVKMAGKAGYPTRDGPRLYWIGK